MVGLGDTPAPPSVRRGPPLVGREADFAALEAELTRAAEGEFRIILLLGDAGVGKTRLARELLASNSGALGLSARAHPLGGTTSFGLWVEALQSHLRGLDAAEVADLCGGFVDDLGGLLRSAAAVRGMAPAGEPARARLIEGLAVLLDNLAARSPMVVFLDDVHLADDSSWDALHYLARNLATTPVLVVAAARPVELAGRPGPNQILLGLEQDDLLTRLTLHPLPSEALAELAAGVLGDNPPAALVSWLQERSRGNPLFALGLLRAVLDEGADLCAPRLRRLPEGLAERVTARVDRLDEAARAVLEVLAVVGRRVDLSGVAALTDRPLDGVGPVLDDLVRTGLINEEERGREVAYEISHPLVQEAIYQKLGTARRRALHRLVGRVLLAAGQLGEAAPHFVRSADAGDREAIDALCDAVRQAEARNLYREALTLLGTLVDLIPSEDERWLEVVDGMVLEADWVVDHRADVQANLAIPALRTIDAMLERSPDPARRAAIKFRLASFLGGGIAELEEAGRVCQAAINLYEKAGDRRGTWLATLELGYLHGVAGDWEASTSTGRRVADAAEAAGDRFVTMQALGRGVGWGGSLVGTFDEAEAAFRRSIQLAHDGGRTYFHAVTLTGLGCVLALDGRIAEAYPVLTEAKAIHPNWRESLQLEFEIMVHWLAGAFDAALQQARESVTWNASGMPRRRALGLAFAALAGVETDQLVEAQRFLDTALEAFAGRPWHAHEVCQHAEAMLQWRKGERVAAVAELRGSATRILSLGFLPLAAFALLDLTELATEARDAQTATSAAAELGEIARRLDRDLYRSLAAIGAAWAGLASTVSDPDPAAVADAVTTLARLGYPAFAGRALDILGRSLGRFDRPRAGKAFEAAAVTFETCGATWRRNRTLEALRRLGGAETRKRTAAILGPAALTSRQREVARLAAQGWTALEIARELFIGERTVETHLARIYRKLGVRSKLELVQRADELALAEPT